MAPLPLSPVLPPGMDLLGISAAEVCWPSRFVQPSEKPLKQKVGRRVTCPEGRALPQESELGSAATAATKDRPKHAKHQKRLRIRRLHVVRSQGRLAQAGARTAP